MNLHSFKDKLERVQNEIVKATNMAVVIVDILGRYVTEKKNYSKFCSDFRKNPNSNKYCENCDKLALDKVFLSKKPYLYRCHSGLVDIAIPIIYKNESIGAFLVGQVLLKDQNNFEIESILNENFEKKLEINSILESYKALEKIPYSTLKAKATILYYMSFYVSHALENHTWYDDNIENNVELERIELCHSNLEPAIKYIHENLHEQIFLEEASDLCNLSISQFSRIFKKEFGKNFKEYVNLKKVEKAKILLNITDKSINQIAFDLGFEDNSYFTKFFKKYEGITPKIFRKKLSNHKL
jgi:ligand-binding sensor protein/AraC-like DNA-binding protein